MLSKLRVTKPSIGSVLVPHAAPRPEHFEHLTKLGVSVKTIEAPSADGSWVLGLSHPAWGRGVLMSIPGIELPGKQLLQYSVGLDEDDRREFTRAKASVGLRVEAKDEMVLADRKRLLRYLRAVMGDAGAGGGIAASDTLTTRFWTREDLDSELAHNADLDVEDIFIVHAIIDPDSPGGESDPRPGWVHTHGLGEIGATDFDILKPAEQGVGGDAFRSLAMAILEGELVADGEPVFIGAPNGVVRLVSTEQFHAAASPADQKIRENDEDHSQNRGILCDPPTKKLFGLVNKTRPVPSTFFRNHPGEGVYGFSSAATDLMSDRARATFGIFTSLLDKARSMELPIIVKLGIPTDSNPQQREHMWFTVHGVDAKSIDATLENQPRDIANMRHGQRAKHSLDTLTDWSIMTPMGNIGPRNLRGARVLRDNPEVIQAMLRMGEGE